MHAGHYSSLLPEIFRHKTTQVRLFKPQIILLDFHGTISERRWEDKIIFPYIKKEIGSYLRDNWSNDTIQKCIPALKNESFEQRFRHKYDDAPIVDDHSSPENEDIDPMQLANQISEFLSWQMASKKETRETQIIGRLVWQEGFRRRQILTPLYDDVMPCFKLWHEKYACRMYIISSTDGETLKLLFENTDKGNLGQYISGYFGMTKTGDKLITDTYKKFYEKLPLEGYKMDSRLKFKLESPRRNCSKSPQPSTLNCSSKSPPSGSSLRILKSSLPSSSENIIRPVLFLTDSGQEAKAASQVADGAAFECLLVNRPGNKRIRSYYLSQFQYVDKFEDIEFV